MLPLNRIILTVFVITTSALGEEVSCDEDYTQSEKWCYKLMESVDRFTSASQDCYSRGAELVSVHSEQENSFIASFGVDVLTGLLFDSRIERFSWDDRTKLDFQSWETNYPMKPDYLGECVVLKKSGRWINVECDLKFHYICKKAASLHQCPVQPNNQFFDYGPIHSPGSPGNYIGGLSCSYFLYAKNYLSVEIQMRSNEMAAGDVIELFSGIQANNDSRIAVIESTDALRTYRTPHGENRMLVRFTSRSQTGGKWEMSFSPTEKCADGWITSVKDGLWYCYRFGEKTGVSRQDAMKECEKLGAKPASIYNREHNKYIASLLKSAPTPIWLGLVYDDEHKSWNWLDGSISSYRNWAKGEPRMNEGNCVVTSESGMWFTSECSPYSQMVDLCYQP